MNSPETRDKSVIIAKNVIGTLEVFRGRNIGWMNLLPDSARRLGRIVVEDLHASLPRPTDQRIHHYAKELAIQEPPLSVLTTYEYAIGVQAALEDLHAEENYLGKLASETNTAREIAD